jgi:hypothetical protein
MTSHNSPNTEPSTYFPTEDDDGKIHAQPSLWHAATYRASSPMPTDHVPREYPLQERLQDFGSLFRALSFPDATRDAAVADGTIQTSTRNSHGNTEHAYMEVASFVADMDPQGRASGELPHGHSGLYRDSAFHEEPSFGTSPFVFLPEDFQSFEPHHPSGMSQPIRYGFDEHDITAFQDPDMDKKPAASPLKAPPNASAPPKSPPKGPSVASKPAAKTKRVRRKRASRGFTVERMRGPNIGPTQEELRWAHTERAKSALCSWYERLNDLHAYRLEHGHSKSNQPTRDFVSTNSLSHSASANVPQKYVENHALGVWVNKQRMEKKLHADGEKSSLTQRRVDLLEQAGFLW